VPGGTQAARVKSGQLLTLPGHRGHRLLVTAAIAAAVGGLVHRTMGGTPTGRGGRAAAPTLVMAARC